MTDFHYHLALAERMRPYNYTELSDKIESIIGAAELHSKHQKLKGPSLEAQKAVDMIKGFYSRVPFGNLNPEREYAPLFTIKDTLPQLEAAIKSYFGKEEVTPEELERVILLARPVRLEGYKYSVAISNLLRPGIGSAQGINTGDLEERV